MSVEVSLIKQQAREIVKELDVKISYISEASANKIIVWKTNLDNQAELNADLKVKKKWIIYVSIAFLFGLILGSAIATILLM